MQLHVNKAKDGRKFVQLKKIPSEILCSLPVRFEVFTAVNIKVIVFWDVML